MLAVVGFGFVNTASASVRRNIIEIYPFIDEHGIRYITLSYKGQEVFAKTGEIITPNGIIRQLGNSRFEGKFFTGKPQFIQQNNRWFVTDHEVLTDFEFYTTYPERLIWDFFNRAYALDFNPSVDGQTWHTANDQSWSAKRAAAGNNVNDANTYFATHIECDEVGVNEYIILVRGHMAFDTSSIDDGATIDSASITLVPDLRADEWVGNGADSYLVVGSTGTYTVSLAASDYAVLNNVSKSNVVAYGDTAVGVDEVFTLNASGLADISSTGYSRFGVKSNYDLADSPTPDNGTCTPNARKLIRWRSTEYAGTEFDPFLTVTWSVGPAPATSPCDTFLNENVASDTLECIKLMATSTAVIAFSSTTFLLFLAVIIGFFIPIIIYRFS